MTKLSDFSKPRGRHRAATDPTARRKVLKRTGLAITVLTSLLAGCADVDQGSLTSATEQSLQKAVTTTAGPAEQQLATSTTRPSTTRSSTTQSPDDSPDDSVVVAYPVRWEQADLPSVEGTDPGRLGRVALVAEDDVLNVRQDPDPGTPVIGTLAPGTVVQRTGSEAARGTSIWVEIATPVGDFWVNDRFLAAVVSKAEFAADSRIETLLERFAAIIAEGGDLLPVTSRRGLYVSHHSDPIRFTPEELNGILTNPTTYRWGSLAFAPDEPEYLQIPPKTFAQAITDRFLSAYDDADTVVTVNEPIAGQSGTIPEYAIPFRFQSFNYVGVYDAGDEYAPLDWVTWYVSIDFEDGTPRIVALTIDEMSP